MECKTLTLFLVIDYLFMLWILYRVEKSIRPRRESDKEVVKANLPKRTSRKGKIVARSEEDELAIEKRVEASKGWPE